MIDIIGAIGGAAVYSLIIGVLVGYSALPEARKIAFIGLAGMWGGSIVTVAAFGGFAPGTAGAIPLPVFAFAAFLIMLSAHGSGAGSSVMRSWLYRSRCWWL
jgi:hypothetical protein